MAALNTKVVTGEVRLAYVHVFEPYSMNEDEEPRYSVVLLVPKTDTDTIAKLREAQKNALENGKSKTFGGKIPADWKSTIRDGDEDADLDKNPEYAGHLYFSVSAKTKPGIVDRNVEPILDRERLFSGCYGRASINAFAYSTKGNKGVSFGLNNLQLTREGEPFGNFSRPTDDFDALGELAEEEDLV